MSKKKRRLKKSVKQKIRIFLITLIVTITGLSYSLMTDAGNDAGNDYPAYQNTVDIDSQSYGKISLSVTADEDILPEDTKISLEEVTDTESDVYKNIQDKLEKDAEDNNVQLAGTLIYDLSFKDSNDNPVETVNDNKIHVYTNYETPASPLAENHNEEVSLKYISHDDQYTVTKPSDDDPATINTDDNNAITDLSMDVHGNTYYALVWEKKTEITLHAVDEENNELIPSTTAEITEETDINSLSAVIDGYTLTSVTADNTDITEVKSEKGKLYYLNAEDWAETSDTNVWFHYAPAEITEDTGTDTPVPEEQTDVQNETNTEEETQPETEETPVTTKQLTKTTDDKKYTVTVTYGDDAGLPEGTDLSLKSIHTDEEKYANAKKAVATNKNVDADTLGMDALDISLKDSDGNKVEPDDKSSVQVSISINDLPDNIYSVDIHHITEEDTSNSLVKGIKRIGRIFDKDIAVSNDTADTVAENVNVINNTANAEFNVNSFSTFTVTWTNNNSDTKKRIASVNLHYVDEDGNDLDDPTEVPTSELNAAGTNGIVTVESDWANNGVASRIAGYTYKEARLSNVKGTQVTGMMAEETTEGNKTTYSLKYTGAESVPTDKTNESWKTVPVDETAGNNNSIDVYLIYTQNDHLTVHYVDSAGEELSEPTVKYFSDLTDEVNFNTDSVGNKAWVPDFRNHTFASAHLSSSLGDTVVSIKKGEDNSLLVKYTAGDADYTSISTTNLFLVYNKDSYTKEVDVYYTDSAGVPITDAAGRQLIKKYDAADWTDGTHNFIDDTKYTPDGYAAYVNSKYAEDFPNWWNNGNHSDGNNTMNRILYVTEKVLSSQHADVVRSVHGYVITSMSYNAAGNNLSISRSGGNTTSNLSEVDNVYKVYLLYKKQVTIHDENTNNEELNKRSASASVGYYAVNRWSNNTLSSTVNNWGTSLNGYPLSTFTDNNNYGTHTKLYVKDRDGNEIDIATPENTTTNVISWQFDGPKTWNTQPDNGNITDSQTTRNGYHWKTRIYTGVTTNNGYQEFDYLITDIHMVYNYTAPLTVTVHHEDSEGNRIADDTTVDIQTTDNSAKTYDDFKKEDITNYTANSFKYGSSDASSITFIYNNNTWKYKLNNDTNETNITNANKPEVTVKYNEATDNRHIVVHYVDEQGNQLLDDKGNAIPEKVSDSTIASSNYSTWNGFTLRTENNSGTYDITVPTGYTFKAEYIGENFDDNHKASEGTSRQAIQYRYYNNKWYTSHGSNAKTPHNNSDNNDASTPVNTSEQTVFQGFITDIYWVYSKTQAKASDITIHYVYPDTTEKTIMEYNGTAQGTPAKGPDGKDLTVSSTIFVEFSTTDLGNDHPKNLQNVTDDTIKAGISVNSDPYISDVTHTDTTDISKSGTYEYVSSFVSSKNTDGTPTYERLTTDAPNVSKVRIVDGKTQYLVNLGLEGADDNGFVSLSRQRSNRWYYSASSGRRFTLRKNGNDFSMIDTNSGGTAIDLNLTSSETNDNNSVNTYTGISSVDGFTTTYTVQETGSSYKLKVQEWTENEAIDIYQVYAPKKEESASVAIKNDMVYSGHLVAEVEGLPGDATITSYNWMKNVNGAGFQPVTRTQRGSNWNVEHDLNQRTYLDLVADDGALRLTNGSDRHESVVYRLEVTYTDSSGTHTIRTGDEGNGVDFEVPYYDQLENGSFETPKKHGDWSNAAYRQAGGVWQTSGRGTQNKSYQDIEIIRSKNDGYGYDSNWMNSYKWYTGQGSDGSQGAKDGDQFAELNAEASGALYQDVVTMPNEYLNYWLSHRARGKERNSTPEYDTMYLVIMPTSLAMTSGSDNGELNDQQELINFVNKYAKGGYEQKLATSVGQEIVCQDYTNGVLIMKISSSDQAWHNISVANGYIAKGSLTRFFFMAGPTAADGPNSSNPTQGNFLDAVGFSQKLQTPDTPHYHMVVRKTFSGLSDDEVAALASNRATAGNGFKFTIDEYNSDGTLRSSTTDNDPYVEYDERRNSQNSLNGATLSFTASANNTFTLTAQTHDGVNLFPRNGSSTGVVSEDPDTGDITMTWTLYANYFPTTVTNKYFKVTESNGIADGYSLSTTNSGTITHAATANTPEETVPFDQKTGNATDTITVKDRDTVRVNYSNSYRNNTNDDPNQITVVKKFTGITPIAIERLTGGTTPYQINVKHSDESDQGLTLVANVQSPVSGDLPDGITDVELSVSDDASTYTWTITGTNDNDNWARAGSYEVSESNFKTGTENPLNSIYINGSKVDTGDNDTATSNVQAGGTDTNNDVPTLTTTDSSPSLISNGLSSGIPISLNESTNLIIARYIEGDNDTTPGYIVLTKGIAGVNLRQAIINFMTSKLSLTTARAETIHFRSGDISTGDISIGSNSTDQAKINYDSTTHQLILTDAKSSTGTRWTGYYATAYNLDTAEKINEVRIANQYNPAIRLMKISSDNDATPLQNAEFQLYKYDSSGTQQYYQADGTYGTVPSAATLKTNSQGVATVNGKDDAASTVSLEPGNTYYIKETKAPPGYNLPSKNVIAVKVDTNGTVSLITDRGDSSLNESEKQNINVDTDQTSKNYVGFDWDSPYYTITVKNTPGFIFPITGGEGVLLYMFAGLLLICMAALLYARKKLKEW